MSIRDDFLISCKIFVVFLQRVWYTDRNKMQGGVVLEQEKFVYIVVSQSGTRISRMLRLLSRDPYNHVSLALDPALQQMYSYGRRKLRNPFIGGFVRETPQTGVFGHFRETDAVVVRLPMSGAEYEKLQARMGEMYQNRKTYRYDYLGVFLAFFGKSIVRKQKSYCSKFVAGELQTAGVMKPEKRMFRPMDFLALPCGETVFQGKLRAYDPMAGEG